MEGQMSIFDLPGFIPEEPKTPAQIWADETGVSDYWQHDIKFVDDKPVCKHSGHSCNRKELWAVADTLLECSHTCCRQCSIRCCGVRCNGSKEPLPEKCLSCKHIMGNDGCYLDECVFEPRLSCQGCIDHKKRSYKNTMCLKGCKRYCYNPNVITIGLEDHYREK